MNLLILGAGGFAREVTDLVEDLGIKVIGYVVDVPGQPEKLLDRPVWQLEEEEVQILASICQIIAAIISPAREGIADKAERMGFKFASVIHISASVSRTAQIQPGVIVNRNATVGRDSVLMRHVILNRGCTIGHDCWLDRGVTIGPGANLAGNVQIGAWTTVGMGANVLEGRRIGWHSVVGVGSVVTHDVPPGETWWGVPAKRMR